MIKKIRNLALLTMFGVGLMSYGSSKPLMKMVPEKYITGKFKKILNKNKSNQIYGLILETKKGDYTVNILNNNKCPLSRLKKEIKIGDSLEAGCLLHYNDGKMLDCFTNSCYVNKKKD